MIEFVAVFIPLFALTYAVGYILLMGYFWFAMALWWLLSPTFRREERERAERIKQYKKEWAEHLAMMDYLNSL